MKLPILGCQGGKGGCEVRGASLPGWAPQQYPSLFTPKSMLSPPPAQCIACTTAAGLNTGLTRTRINFKPFLTKSLERTSSKIAFTFPTAKKEHPCATCMTPGSIPFLPDHSKTPKTTVGAREGEGRCCNEAQFRSPRSHPLPGSGHILPPRLDFQQKGCSCPAPLGLGTKGGAFAPLSAHEGRQNAWELCMRSSA